MDKKKQKQDLSKLTKQEQEALRKVEGQLRGYQNKSEAQLMQEVQRIAKQSKASGELNPQKLRQFENSVKGMLDPAQQQKLKAILNSLKTN